MNYDPKVYQQISQVGAERESLARAVADFTPYAATAPKYMQATYTDPGPGRSSQGDNLKPPVRGKTSPYGFFVKMCYEEHKKKYPNENVQVTEISKKCSEKWKTMSEDEKRRFFELAQKDAERYQAEVAAYGGEDAMKKKKKKVAKDPNAPKRALSAFFIFSNEKRQEVQQQHPEWKVGQVAQELGRVWKNLTEEEKGVYEHKAQADKSRYAEEMKNYQGTKNIAQQQQQQQQQQMHQQHQQMVVTEMPMQIHHMSVPQMHNTLGQM